jgi:putative transposase
MREFFLAIAAAAVLAVVLYVLRAAIGRIIALNGIEPSVGSRDDSYDNALAESVIGLFKTEVIRHRGPWRGIEDVEFATLNWVAWYNGSRLLEPLGYVPPSEFEEAFYRRRGDPAENGFHNRPRSHDLESVRLPGRGNQEVKLTSRSSRSTAVHRTSEAQILT